MSLHDIVPAHFLSSPLVDESLLLSLRQHKGSPAQAAQPAPPAPAPPSTPPADKRPFFRRAVSHQGPPRSPPSAPVPVAQAVAQPQPQPQPQPHPQPQARTRARALSSSQYAHPLPAPMAVPAARRRSPSASAALHRPALSSSPTHTPFSVTPVSGNGTPPPARRGGTISPILIPRTPSPAAAAPKLPPSSPSPGSQPSLSPISVSPPSPKRGTGPPALSASAGSSAGGVSPTASSPKKRAWGRFFDFDHMLGALDPNRVAAASAPRPPVKAVVFCAETESGLATCRTLIASGDYVVTALTVDAESAAAKELRDGGIRVVAVDMDSPVSYSNELAGAEAVYLSSNVLALHAILHHQPEPRRTEIARAADRCQLSKAVNACKRAKVGHVVFRVNACGHEVVENVLGKSRGQPFMEATEDDLERLGINHTVLHTTVPFSRITEWLDDGKDGLILNVPVPDDCAMPLFSIEQTGDYVLAALRNPAKWAGKEMHAIASVLTPGQIAARLSQLSRRPVDTMHPTREEFMSLETHERLTCRWDAWAQLVRHEYTFDHVTRATKLDVPDELDFNAWINQDKEIHRRLRF